MSGTRKSRRIALLSDIHGNLPALEAVLADAAGHAVDAIWNLGDFLGYAPFPNEVVEKSRTVGAVSVIGNYDLKVLAFEQKQDTWKRTKMAEKYAAFQWNHEHLSGRTAAFLAALPQQERVSVNGSTVLLVHGSPVSVDELLGSRTPEPRFEELAEMAAVDLIACGHSHEAFVRRAKDTWFVNPGSVGRPEGDDGRASYALLELAGDGWKVRHRRVSYDIERVVRAIHEAGLPDEFVDVFRKARSLDELRDERVDNARSSHSDPSDSGNALEAVLALAQRCHYERDHTHQVTKLALALFDELQEVHGMGAQERRWLHYGALLHDIGWVDGQQAHHKTSLRLIVAESGLPFKRRERQIIGLIARYHRKALPRERHRYFARLNSEDQHRVRVLAGILRVADGLDRSHLGVIRTVRCDVSSRGIAVVCVPNGPAAGEKAAAEKKADLLEQVFGRRCVIKIAVRDG